MKIGTAIIVALLALSMGASIYAQQPAGAKQPAARRAAAASALNVANLLHDARSAPPEFAADVLLRVAQSNLIAGAQKRREMLREVFQRAGDAQHPLKLIAVPAIMIDTHPGYLARAYELNLDALSLRAESVSALAKLDRREALELFRTIPEFALPPLTCEDHLVYDVSAYYRALTLVAQGSFTPEEMSRDEHIRFVESYINKANSPLQLTPLAGAILAAAKTPAQLSTLVHAFTRALRQLQADDRAFSISEGALLSAVQQLAERSQRNGVPPNDLLETTRVYLVRQLSGDRCADNVNPIYGEYVKIAYTEQFNKALLAQGIDPQSVPAISREEATPARVRDVTPAAAYWQTPTAMQLLQEMQALNTTAERQPLTLEYKQGAKWQLQLQTFLNHLADWDERSEQSVEDHFNQKSVLYYSVLRLLPSGPARDDLVNKYVAFLQQPMIEQTNRILWLSHVKSLLALTNSASDSDREKVISALLHSADPLLQLYGATEKLLPRERAQQQRPASPKPSLKGNMTFRLRGFADARVVSVAGSFNNWRPGQLLCAHQGEEWVCRVELAPGKYTYKFIVDGRWLIDPANPLSEDDGRGNINSILVVPEK